MCVLTTHAIGECRPVERWCLILCRSGDQSVLEQRPDGSPRPVRSSVKPGAGQDGLEILVGPGCRALASVQGLGEFLRCKVRAGCVLQQHEEGIDADERADGHIEHAQDAHDERQDLAPLLALQQTISGQNAG